MVTGTLATAGYWTDKKEWLPDKYNPKGYYEDPEIHRINETILSSYVTYSSTTRCQDHADTQTAPNLQGWLGLVDIETDLKPDGALIPRMKYYLAKEPYCFKDVRFSYTLDIWRPFLQNTKFVCVFRNPASTIQSIVHYCSQREYLKPLNIDAAYAQELWTRMYSHVLQKHAHSGEWFFVHYDQLFDNAVLDRLEQFSGTKIDRTFPEQRLRKSVPEIEHNQQISRIFEELCHRANFEII